MKTPITKLTVGSEEARAVQSVLESGWLIQGPKVQEFEGTLRKYVGAKYAVACSSCTTALHMGMIALGIRANDPVIVPAFTFVATPNAVEYVGAKPIFADIDIDTFNIDYRCLNDEITKRNSRFERKVRAIVPVHLFGLCAEMDKINQIAMQSSSVVLEDAACALGSTYKGQFAGTISQAGCYSFHPRKSLTTGEGGMLVTSDKLIYDQTRSLRDFGFDDAVPGSTAMPDVRMLGFNYRMTDIQGAIGIEQFKKFVHTVESRQRLAKVYDLELSGTSWLKLPTVSLRCNHTYQSYVTLVWDETLIKPSAEKIDKLESIRNRFTTHLLESGIATRQGTQAVHTLNYYQKKYHIKGMDFPFAWIAARLSVTLPLFPQMTNEEQDYVISKIKEFKP